MRSKRMKQEAGEAMSGEGFGRGVKIGRRTAMLGALTLALMLVSAAPAWALDPLSVEQMEALLVQIDERQRSVGDYKALAFIEQKQKGKSDLVYESVIYRRDSESKLLIMFLKPKSEAGKGYLRLEDNLFLYDPSVGKWERRTDRENIGGTGSQRRDFDASSFSKDYTPTYVKADKLGKFEVHQIELNAKKGADVSYPKMHVWVDARTNSPLKVQEFALSGKLMRTSYYPKWSKVKNEEKGSEVYFPKEIRIFDEVEEGTSTTIVMQKVELEELPDNIFTKAWLESKSR